jgi:hypothetical protein
MTYFKGKNFHLPEGPILKFFVTRTKKIDKQKKYRKMPFLKQSYISFANPKLHEA